MAQIRVNVIWPLDTDAKLSACLLWLVQSFHNCQCKKILDKDNLASEGNGKASHERERQATGWRKPRVAPTPTTSGLE